MNLAPDTLRAAAARCGARIVRDALWHEGRCTWIGATMDVVGQQWGTVERTLGADLYGGTAGIAVFLSRLYEQTGDTLFRHTAEGALRQARARLDGVHPSVAASFYSGRAGVAYAFLVAGDAAQREDLAAEGRSLLRSLDAAAEPLEHWDLLGGGAGTIPLLLGLERREPGGGWGDLAVRYGEEILRAAHRANGTASWESPGQPEQRHLLGLAHGASGIGWALLELSAATADPRFREVGLEAFAYERRWFDSAEGNWPDFRETTIPEGEEAGGEHEAGGQAMGPAADHAAGQAASQAASFEGPGNTARSFMSAWCHGAPGIGLARLRALRLVDDPVIRHEAAAAVASTRRAAEQMLGSPYVNFSLCHGLGSFGETLLLADETCGDEAARREAEKLAEHGLERFEKERLPWPGGVSGGGETPALMLGAAGAGYFLLRLADPAAVPSILLLSPESLCAVPSPVG